MARTADSVERHTGPLLVLLVPAVSAALLMAAYVFPAVGEQIPLPRYGGWPLIALFGGLLLFSVLLYWFLRRHNKPELTASCLALSIALHLFLFACFSVWGVRQAAPPAERLQAADPSHCASGRVDRSRRQRFGQ